MLKNIILKKCLRKIGKLKPEVHLSLNREIPTPSMKEIAKLAPLVSKVNSFEEEVKSKPDSFFREKTLEYKELIKQKTANIEADNYKETVNRALDEILPFYFAMVREAAQRTVKMRHFDVQILGGAILHHNKISEMVTGEGKTLVATLAASLNALASKVHVVTVNDYLARRDSEWMGPIYQFLGLSVGVIQQDMNKPARGAAYACDITYGTNNEFGFDYLRDNMVTGAEDMVQGEHFYAIVDEVDSILIDEARTPLIISGPAESYIEKYYLADRAVRNLRVKVIIQSFDRKDGTVTVKNLDGSETQIGPGELEDKYEAIVEEKTHNAYLTLKGERACERALGVSSVSEDCPDKRSNPWMHYLTQSLRAHYLFKADREYIAKDNRVVIVDEFTGRLMPGRRWSDGLHQAVEAKEKLRIQEESQTLATITLQNYFRMYTKLAGMTGTAYTEANEFNHIYKLDVVAIPTNRPLTRLNQADRIYKTKKGKFDAVVVEIEELSKLKRPVLVGTTSIEDSEELAFLLAKKGIKHNILNAKYHEREAHIIAQAGSLGQVTIATNMAGRGTDIILGGNLDYFIKDLLKKNSLSFGDESYQAEYDRLHNEHKDKFIRGQAQVIALGGLHIIGTQRHESRRIDNQLRGRSGRQGDPGSSRFYVSLQDDLMRLFGSERIYNLMDTFGFREDEPIEHALINHSLAAAQKRVEGHNFEIRKQLLQYDNIMNKQREVIYRQRKEILQSESIKEEILAMIDDVVEKNLPLYFQDDRDLLGLIHWLKSKFQMTVESKEMQGLNLEEATKFIREKLSRAYFKKEADISESSMRMMEKSLSLWVVDSRWKEHLLTMDYLREGIHLRAHAHVDPLVEYQKEAYFAFEEMIFSIKEGIVDLLFKAKAPAPSSEAGIFVDSPLNLIHSDYSALNKNSKPVPPAPANPKPQVLKAGRNEPCPCGSGKKYKKCCGK